MESTLRRALLAALLYFATACAFVGDPGYPLPQSVATILIQNSNLDPMRVYLTSGYVGTVMPNEVRCFTIRGGLQQEVLRVYTAGEWYQGTAFIPMEFDGGWAIALTTTIRYDIYYIQPSARCRQVGGKVAIEER
jgi:hypothetical protein